MGDMTDKVVLITGAAGAIGKPTSMELARRGAVVVMAGRAPRIEAAASEVRAATGSSTVETLDVDLASLRSIRAAAQAFAGRHPKLHVLINNAATFSRERKTTTDGFELQFGTNHLGHFLLTNLLLEPIKAASPSRVVLLTMGAKGPIPFDDLDSERKYAPLDALVNSKAAITCFAVELAKRLDGTGVVVNAVNPELTKSTLPREAPLPLRLVFALFGASPTRSKDYIVRVACDPAFEKVSGRFYRKDVEKPIPALLSDPAVRERLWKESSRRVGLA